MKDGGGCTRISFYLRKDGEYLYDLVMKFEFRNIEPHPMLRPYIEKMWVFECSGKLPCEDLKLIVPNGNIKLAVAAKNGLTAVVDGRKITSKEGSINLTGVVDMPLVLDTEKDMATETIGIEFNPKGAYRFFHFDLDEVRNQIYSMDELLGNAGKRLEEEIVNAASARQKIVLLQQFLLNQLLLNTEDPIFEYCVEKIKLSSGRITVRELEKKTGYSSRWLNMKFTERLGVSPKNISSIIRFGHYYRALASDVVTTLSRNDFYESYFDQSHFIKDFKRYTGLSPRQLENRINEFGRKFYKQ